MQKCESLYIQKRETEFLTYGILSSMNNILVLLPEDARLYSESLAGIRRRFGSDYQERIVDYAINPATLRRLIDFWKPLGCIVFAWNDAHALPARSFAHIPTVYMDRSRPSGGQSLMSSRTTRRAADSRHTRSSMENAPTMHSWETILRQSGRKREARPSRTPYAFKASPATSMRPGGDRMATLGRLNDGFANCPGP